MQTDALNQHQHTCSTAVGVNTRCISLKNSNKKVFTDTTHIQHVNIPKQLKFSGILLWQFLSFFYMQGYRINFPPHISTTLSMQVFYSSFPKFLLSS